MYAGAATQMATSSGSRPASAAAFLTAAMLHSAIDRSASCRMNPSATSPVSWRTRGPYAATQTSRVERWLHGNRRWLPLYSTSSPLARPRITAMESRSSATVLGRPLVTRTAESPRPIPQMVRLPYISFSVAKVEAVTVQSRVAGLVTIGPTTILRVAARIAL